MATHRFLTFDIAKEGDLKEILDLQKFAYKENAIRYDNYNIPPLIQTIEELKNELKSHIILKVVQGKKIIGSVRAYEKDRTCYIERLIVHPEYQNRGIGKKLMETIEKYFKGVRYELFTGQLDKKNLAFYKKLGYTEFRTKKVSDNLTFVYLEKNSNN